MDIIVLIIAALVAYIIKGVCGFANTLVFTSIAGFIMDNVLLTPVELLMSFPSDLILVIQNRKKIDLKTAAFLSTIVLLGTIVGVILLKQIDSRIIKVVFGGVVVLLAAEMYLRDYQMKEYHHSFGLGTIVGFASGILCGLFGIGALLVAYVVRTSEDMESFKATLNVVYTVNNIIRIFLYSAAGLLTIQSVIIFILLCPFVFGGLYIGIKLSKVLAEETVKKYVIMFLFITGVSLVVTNIL